jgi:hypothetical protein
MSPRRDKRIYGRTAQDVRRKGLGGRQPYAPSTNIGEIMTWIRINGVDVAYSCAVQAINVTT